MGKTTMRPAHMGRERVFRENKFPITSVKLFAMEKVSGITKKNVKIVWIAISRKRHFRSPKRKNENTLLYKVPPKTWENSPQKPLLATRKWFFGHCYVQNVRFLKILQCPDFEIFFGDTWHLFHTKKLDGSDGGFNFSKNTLSSHVIWIRKLSKFSSSPPPSIHYITKIHLAKSLIGRFCKIISHYSLTSR